MAGQNRSRKNWTILGARVHGILANCRCGEDGWSFKHISESNMNATVCQNAEGIRRVFLQR